MAEGLCRDTQYCIVKEERGWLLRVCVTIQSLYRDKRVAWLRACHDTSDCIVIGGQRYGCWLCRDTTQPGLRYGAQL